MKPLVDGQCGQSNSLVGLSRNFTQNNSRLQSGVDAQIRNVMPAMSRGDQFADEFLSRISAQTLAPTTFNMKSLGQTLPSSSPQLSQQWSNDFNQRYRSQQPSTTSSSSTLSNQWLKQYNPSHQQSLSQSSTASTISTTQKELEQIWNQSQKSAVEPLTTTMWSTEYLNSFDNDPFFEAKQKGNEWANQYLESESIRQNIGQQQPKSHEEMFENFKSEWDSLANAEFGDNYFSGNTDVNYQFQRVRKWKK
jgi:hypothetical protein